MDILSYDDLEEIKTAAEATRLLKFRQQGAPYVVEEGDIMFFKIQEDPGS